MVTALKVSATASLSSACSAGAAIGASVKTKDSMVAMSGAIMPAPLAMPLMVTVALPSRARRGRDLRKRVGGHDGAGGVEPAAALRVRHKTLHHAGERARVERLADHAGRGEEHLVGLAADGLGGEFGGERAGRAAGLAGKRIGVAGIDHERAGACGP